MGIGERGDGVDNRRREARGELARFIAAGSGDHRLRTVATEVELAIERWNDLTKKELLEQLGQIDPATFEELIGELLEKIGFEHVEVTRRSGDGGIDVRGVLTVGGMTRVKTAIQVKRWANKVPDRIVRELRGSIGPAEQGLIITTSGFTKSAIKEAEMTDRAPVTLIDGKVLAEHPAEYEIGIKRQSRPVLQLDETTLAGATGTEVGSNGGSTVPGKTPVGMYRSLWPLPGGNQAYVTALEKLLPLASGQPTTAHFIARLQQEFPQVESLATAGGYVRVLVALGFVEIDGGQISLTPTGRDFVETQNIETVRDALRRRIVGIKGCCPSLKRARARWSSYSRYLPVWGSRGKPQLKSAGACTGSSRWSSSTSQTAGMSSSAPSRCSRPCEQGTRPPLITPRATRPSSPDAQAGGRSNLAYASPGFASPPPRLRRTSLPARTSGSAASPSRGRRRLPARSPGRCPRPRSRAPSRPDTSARLRRPGMF